MGEREIKIGGTCNLCGREMCEHAFATYKRVKELEEQQAGSRGTWLCGGCGAMYPKTHESWGQGRCVRCQENAKLQQRVKELEEQLAVQRKGAVGMMDGQDADIAKLEGWVRHLRWELHHRDPDWPWCHDNQMYCEDCEEIAEHLKERESGRRSG
jgi:uncharacterized coiled-coil protein SlyX